ncbi:hypothetical protein [Kribbella sancticallisti]|uniref:hypothetical protein n=1 Tax=Kribbella sancticallisti TaxID=460087 RepID=UPI0031D88310
MVEQPDEEAAAAVERLQQELLTRPEDNDLRTQLAWAIRRLTEESLAVTVYEVRVIASDRQRRMAREASARILELAPWDGDLRAFATNLSDEVERGGRWTWESKALAQTLAACVAVIGLALVVAGGLVGSIPLIVTAALLSSAGLACVVLGFRREAWRITAREAEPLLERAGI